jgi:predicted nucleic acid-binding protein
MIHLDELGCLDLLVELGDLMVPERVWQEVQRHRPRLRIETIPDLRIVSVSAAASPALAALVRSLDLDAGESQALSLLESLRGNSFLTDDSAARLAGEALGFRVHGSIGILLRAIRRGLRSTAQVRQLLESIPARSTLHLSRDLLRQVMESLREG